MNRLTAIAAAIALLGAPAIASAADFVAKVKTSDLNLQTDAGAKTALQRIHRAAKNACTDITVGSRIGQADKSCVDQVSAELVKRLGAPLVQAAFEAQQTKG
jgi:UrcA family protein